MCPCRAFGECVYVRFSVETWDPVRPKYPNKYKTSNVWVEKKRKKEKCSAGHIKRVCTNSGSLKNGVDLGLWRNLGFYARTSLYLLAHNLSPSVWCSLINAGRQSVQNPRWTENPNKPIFLQVLIRVYHRMLCYTLIARYLSRNVCYLQYTTVLLHVAVHSGTCARDVLAKTRCTTINTAETYGALVPNVSCTRNACALQ